MLSWAPVFFPYIIVLFSTKFNVEFQFLYILHCCSSTTGVYQQHQQVLFYRKNKITLLLITKPKVVYRPVVLTPISHSQKCFLQYTTFYGEMASRATLNAPMAWKLYATLDRWKNPKNPADSSDTTCLSEILDINFFIAFLV